MSLIKDNARFYITISFAGLETPTIISLKTLLLSKFSNLDKSMH